MALMDKDRQNGIRIKRGKCLDLLLAHFDKIIQSKAFKKAFKSYVDNSVKVNLLGEPKLCFLHMLLSEFKMNAV